MLLACSEMNKWKVYVNVMMVNYSGIFWNFSFGNLISDINIIVLCTINRGNNEISDLNDYSTGTEVFNLFWLFNFRNKSWEETLRLQEINWVCSMNKRYRQRGLVEFQRTLRTLSFLGDLLTPKPPLLITIFTSKFGLPSAVAHITFHISRSPELG